MKYLAIIAFIASIVAAAPIVVEERQGCGFGYNCEHGWAKTGGVEKREPIPEPEPVVVEERQGCGYGYDCEHGWAKTGGVEKREPVPEPIPEPEPVVELEERQGCGFGYYCGHPWVETESPVAEVENAA